MSDDFSSDKINCFGEFSELAAEKLDISVCASGEPDIAATATIITRAKTTAVASLSMPPRKKDRK